MAIANPFPNFMFRRLMLTGITAILLAACQSLPMPKGFNAAQIAMLKTAGFVETTRGWELSMADRLLFAVNDSRLETGQVATISNLGAQLIAVSIATARVEGHSDSTGTSDYNARLSAARAQAVAAPLRTGGMNLADDQIVGRGEAFPIGDNGTEAGRADNRRVVIIVTPPGA